MNVIYTDAAKQWGEGRALLQQANEQLQRVIGRFSEEVSVEWDRGQDERGRTVYTIKLSDDTDEAAASLTPEELRESTHLRSRLRHVWGDLLEARSNRQMKRLQQMVAEME
jgi:hypothetical protein